MIFGKTGKISKDSIGSVKILSYRHKPGNFENIYTLMKNWTIFNQVISE